MHSEQYDIANILNIQFTNLKVSFDIVCKDITKSCIYYKSKNPRVYNLFETIRLYKNDIILKIEIPCRLRVRYKKNISLEVSFNSKMLVRYESGKTTIVSNYKIIDSSLDVISIITCLSDSDVEKCTCVKDLLELIKIYS